MINWRARDPNLFDDYRPIFEDMNFQKRIIPQKLIMKLEKKEYALYSNYFQISLIVKVRIGRETEI